MPFSRMWSPFLRRLDAPANTRPERAPSFGVKPEKQEVNHMLRAIGCIVIILVIIGILIISY